MIMVAPNGARRTKADHPALPMTAAELAAIAVECLAAGASAIHMHVRDASGAHSLDPGLYREATDAVRSSIGARMVIQVTTEAVGRFTPAEQMATVRALVPEAVSIALREIAPDDASLPAAGEFFAWMKAAGIAPQFILYAPDEVARFAALSDRGVIPFAAPFLLFVLGRYTAGQQSDPRDLDPFVAALGARPAPWAVCAFGRREAECAVHAARLGGHVRIGFENNLHLPDGTLAPSNAALVAATAAALSAEGFRPMSAPAARAVMGVADTARP
jgi:uncharacterized protein (DUF849 family)